MRRFFVNTHPRPVHTRGGISFDGQSGVSVYFGAVATVGDQLRQARELRGLSVPEVVEQTKMKTDQVLAIEAGDWSGFAAPVYTKGFVRNYASLLRMDVETLLAELDTEMGRAREDGDGATGNAPLRSGLIDGLMLHFSGVKWRAVLPIFLLVSLAAGGYFGINWYRNAQTADPLEGISPGLNAEETVTQRDRLPFAPPGN